MTDFPDIRSVPPDVHIPPLSEKGPAPGARVRQTGPEYEGTEVHHVLYLPSDWTPGRQYPIIVEYAGNGNFKNKFGDVSTGKVEDSKLGYGMSGGKGFIWICMPYIDAKERKNQVLWWGDVDATVDYCKKTIHRVCEEYGGDPSAVFLTGFSRGAIACGYIGLHDDDIADIWLAFIPYSHYDGVRDWWYEGSDKASARKRLARLMGRASFVCQERGIDATKQYIEACGIHAPFTFQPILFRNHNDAWALRDIPERRALRAWLRDVLATRPGTHTIRGRIADATGGPIGGVRIESGCTHWTHTGPDGCYELRGLIDSGRDISASKDGYQFAPTRRGVTLSGEDLGGIDFTARRRREP